VQETCYFIALFLLSVVSTDTDTMNNLIDVAELRDSRYKLGHFITKMLTHVTKISPVSSTTSCSIPAIIVSITW